MMIRSPSSSLSYVIFPPSVVVVAFIGPTSIIERLTSLCIDSLCYLFWCHDRTLYFPARFLEKPRVVRHEVQGDLFAAPDVECQYHATQAVSLVRLHTMV